MCCGHSTVYEIKLWTIYHTKYWKFTFQRPSCKWQPSHSWCVFLWYKIIIIKGVPKETTKVQNNASQVTLSFKFLIMFSLFLVHVFALNTFSGICEYKFGQCTSQWGMQDMTRSHASQDSESTCESHSYWKLTVLKWVLRLKCKICMARMTRWLADCPSPVSTNRLVCCQVYKREWVSVRGHNGLTNQWTYGCDTNIQ